MTLLKRYPSCWICFGDDALKVAGACDATFGPPRRLVKLPWSMYNGKPIFGFELSRLEEVLAKCRAAGLKVTLEQPKNEKPKTAMFNLT